LIFVAQLVQTEDGDDVLQFFITLEDQLHAVGSIVMRVAYNLRREDTAGGVQGIHGRIDTKVGDLTAQYRGRIQVGEGRCGSGIGQVIRRHIYRLDGGNGTVLGRSDTFLHETHFRGQRGLVSYGGGHTTQQSRYFGAGLGETEDIVYKEEDITSLSLSVAIAVVFGDGQTAERHAGTGTWGFVHLTEDEGSLRLRQLIHVHLTQVPAAMFHAMFEILAVFHDTGFDHFTHQVVTFAGTLTNTGEYGQTGIGFGDVIDQLLDKYRFTYTRATEQADLTTFCIGLDQVDDFDTGEKYFGAGAQVFEGWGFGVDRAAIGRGNGRQSVDGITGHVEQTTLDRFAGRHFDRGTNIGNRPAPDESFGTVHCDTTNAILTKVLLNLQNQGFAIGLFQFQRVINLGEFAFKLHIDNSADDLLDLTGTCHIKVTRF